MTPPTSQLVYSSSSALSPRHFRLVRELEQVTSATQLQEVLGNHVEELQARWKKRDHPPSSASLRHDLILALYCKSQQSTPPTSEGKRLDLSFCLPEAIQLAGAGRSIGDRRIGYRACDELFTEEPHPLKLLLVNTIIEDLCASSSLSHAESRWQLGLQALISPRIVTGDMVPAIQPRVFELFATEPAVIRRLALQALLSMIEAESATSSSLVVNTRCLVLEALASPSSLPASSKPKKSTSSRPYPPEQDPQVLSVLLKAISRQSPLQPVTSGDGLLRLHLNILRRIMSTEWDDVKWRYRGVTCGWLCVKVLEGMAAVLNGKETLSETIRLEALQAIFILLDAVLDRAHLAFGLFLAIFSCFPSFTTTNIKKLDSTSTTPFARALKEIRSHLGSTNPNLQFLALRALTDLPPEIWTEGNESEWGEKAWSTIMRFLNSKDSSLRKQTLKLLVRVDPHLADLHVSRLVTSMSSLPGGDDKLRSSFLSLALEASSVVDVSCEAWVLRLEQLLSPKEKSEVVLEVVVLETLARLATATPSVQADFSSQLIRRGRWRTEGTMALIFAASCGQGETATEKRQECVDLIIEWLLSADVLEPMLEPFMICLVRLVSKLPDNSPELSLLDQHFHRLSRSRNSPTEVQIQVQHISQIFSRCRSSVNGQRALRCAGEDRRSATLPGFLAALQHFLSQPDCELNDFHSTSSGLVPLRYEPYQPSPSSGGLKQDAGAHQKDRRIRGGKGSTMAQSLMTAGELALIGINQDYDLSDADSESSHAHLRKGGIESVPHAANAQARRQETLALEPSLTSNLVELMGINPFNEQ